MQPYGVDANSLPFTREAIDDNGWKYPIHSFYADPSNRVGSTVVTANFEHFLYPGYGGGIASGHKEMGTTAGHLIGSRTSTPFDIVNFNTAMLVQAAGQQPVPMANVPCAAVPFEEATANKVGWCFNFKNGSTDPEFANFRINVYAYCETLGDMTGEFDPSFVGQPLLGNPEGWRATTGNIDATACGCADLIRDTSHNAPPFTIGLPLWECGPNVRNRTAISVSIIFNAEDANWDASGVYPFGGILGGGVPPGVSGAATLNVGPAELSITVPINIVTP